MQGFRWLGQGHPPPACDLRAHGWRLVGEGDLRDEARLAVQLVWAGLPGTAHWPHLLRAMPRRERRSLLILGIEDGALREALLAGEVGDVAGAIGLGEIELRARRIVAASAALPREAMIGSLRLCLISRDAFLAERRAGLHPREFALLWRLGEAGGEPVGAAELLRDVWHLVHRPETNTLAVHIARLRGKLRRLGLEGLVGTTADGAYFLAVAPRLHGKLPLDAYLRLGEDPCGQQQDLGHAA